MKADLKRTFDFFSSEREINRRTSRRSATSSSQAIGIASGPSPDRRDLLV
jgi:hypothetical protein